MWRFASWLLWLLPAWSGLWAMPRVQEGWIDFQGRSPTKPLALTGEWDFFWKQLLGPETKTWPQVEQRVQTSRSWESFVDLKTGKLLGPKGYATYRVRITGLPPRTDGYEISLYSASSSTQFLAYREGQESAVKIRKAGVVGASPKEHVPLMRPLHLEINPDSAQDVWVVVAQVANYHYSKGGLWNDIYLGPGQMISRQQEIGRLSNLFAIGIIFIVGIYNFINFRRRRVDQASLILAIFCLVIVSRALSSGQVLTYLFEADGPWFYQINYFFEYTSMIIAPGLYALFIGKSFPGARLKKAEGLLLRVTVMAVLATLLLDVGIYSAGLILYQLLIGCWALYSLVALFRAMWLKEEGAQLALAGGLILSVAVVSDILVR